MVKALIQFPDFAKLDLRVGLVEKAEKVEGSKNLIRLTVNFGTDYGTRKIISGIAGWYKPAQLKGKKYVFLANLSPKQMMKEMSEGMILVAENAEDDIRLIPVPKTIKEGSKIL